LKLLLQLSSLTIN